MVYDTKNFSFLIFFLILLVDFQSFLITVSVKTHLRMNAF